MQIISSSVNSVATANGVGIPASEILRRFQNIMMDAKAIRWSIQEALDWMNDAAGEIVLRRPASRAVTEQVMLVAGTYQIASDGAAQVLDVVRNISPSGKPGRAIRIADRQQIDDAEPDWHSKRPGPTRHYMVDERSPTSFYVYPPAQDGAMVEMVVSKAPPKVNDIGEILDLRPEFMSAILNWMMYRAHTKDSEFSQGQVAALHYQAFTDAIGAPAQAAQVNSATGNSK